MKIAVVGLGAVGGLMAARLAAAGHEVSALARGATLAAVRAHGGIAYRVVASSDDPSAFSEALSDQLVRADLVITSGGVSKGTHDVVKEVLSELGTVEFIEVAMQPGKPQGFGFVGEDQTPIFTLPGNPVSAYVSFEMFVVPALHKLTGRGASSRTLTTATLQALARNPWARGLFVLASLVAALLALWWRGPEWDTVYHAFDFVRWRWVVVGVVLNLLSVLARALSWNVTIHQALPPPLPRFMQVFSAFGVGLLGNAVLPARAGELARVAVLRRHLPSRPGTSATLLYNRFGRRIDAVGTALLPDVFEEARGQLDLVVDQPLGRGVSVKLAANRLLGTVVRFTQGGDVVRQYDTGRTFSLSASWSPGGN